jgi:PTH1 family peptidyl-tRNA hydrolase
MQIIIGLGNPGEKYAATRHNAGWLALDQLIGANDWRTEKKFQALIKENNACLYLKPLGFMNNSGTSAYQSLRYYHLLERQFACLTKKDQNLQKNLFVIHDDLDLNLGTWKISQDSSSGGNKGVQSIITHLKTQRFTRLRLGIKTEALHNPLPADKFVLQKFSKEEISIFKQTATEGLEALKKFITTI